jgi:hypothetical protein
LFLPFIACSKLLFDIIPIVPARNKHIRRKPRRTS